MKSLLKLEHFALFILSIYLFSFLPFSWWWFIVLFITPDIGMVGYVFNTKIGAATYNLFHFIAIGISLYILGWILGSPIMSLTGTIVIGHSSFDRFFGFGLKFTDSFKHTHLGNLR